MATQKSSSNCARLPVFPPTSSIAPIPSLSSSFFEQTTGTLVTRFQTQIPTGSQLQPVEMGVDTRHDSSSKSQLPFLNPQIGQDQSGGSGRDALLSGWLDFSSCEEQPFGQWGHVDDCLSSSFGGSSRLEPKDQPSKIQVLAEELDTAHDHDVDPGLSPFTRLTAIQREVETSYASKTDLSPFLQKEAAQRNHQFQIQSSLPTAPKFSTSLGLFLPAEGQMAVLQKPQSSSSEIGLRVAGSTAIDNDILTGPPTAPKSEDESDDVHMSLLSRRQQGSGRLHGAAQMLSEWTHIQDISFPANHSWNRSGEDEQHVFAYKRSLMEAHTNRLGGLLGLAHPLPSPDQQYPTLTPCSQLSQPQTECSGAHARQSPLLSIRRYQTSTSAFPSTKGKAGSEQPLITLQNSIPTLFVVNREDTILWTCSSILTTSGIVSDSHGTENTSRYARSWTKENSESSCRQRIKFSDLLADEQEVRWWQNCCREVLLAQDQEQRIVPQYSNSAESCTKPVRSKKEIILRWHSQQGDNILVEVAILAIQALHQSEKDCLMVRVKPTSIPTLANVSSQPMLTSVTTRRLFASSAPQLNCLADTMMPERAEMRLLVSRYGLILRASCPRHSLEAPGGNMEARATFAILGDGASMPAFGQSLVDIPKLTPLLHVVAQAAVVGLAQTVKLYAGGRRIIAVVQPVLQAPIVDAGGSRHTISPVAKVWIILSAATTVKLRPKTSVPPVTAGFSSSFSAFMGLTPPQPNLNRSLPLDRRHSVNSFYQHKSSSLSSPTARQQKIESRKASAYNSCATSEPPIDAAFYGEHVERAVRVEDHLSELMAQVKEQNRVLREELEKRRRKYKP